MRIFNTTRLAFQDAPVSLNRWKSGHLAYEMALARIEDFARDHLAPARDAFMAIRNQWPEDSQLKPGSIAQIQIDKARTMFDPVQTEYDALVEQANCMADDLLATPAPSVSALAAKFQIFLESPHRGHRGAEPMMRLLMDDARRLSGDI